MKALTDKQRAVLAYLADSVRRRGFPPTIREIREAFRLRSNRSVVDHLRALERKGMIRRIPGSSRAIEIVEADGRGRGASGAAAALPVAGRIAAGSPEAPAAVEGEEYLIDERLFPGGADFLLEVKGESMIGEHIVPGDLVVVKRGACETGAVVVALVDGETTLKRYRRTGSGAVLEPANPACAPIVLSGGRGEGAAVLGAVVGVIRRRPARRGGFSR